MNERGNKKMDMEKLAGKIKDILEVGVIFSSSEEIIIEGMLRVDITLAVKYAKILHSYVTSDWDAEKIPFDLLYGIQEEAEYGIRVLIDTDVDKAVEFSELFGIVSDIIQRKHLKDVIGD